MGSFCKQAALSQRDAFELVLCRESADERHFQMGNPYGCIEIIFYSSPHEN